jgi:hypothetical protein
MSILGASAFQYPYPSYPETDNILGCYPDGNNYSKVCPVLYCNYGKQNQQNNDIFKRIHPEINMEVIPTYRSKYKVCLDVKNQNDEKLWFIVDSHHLESTVNGFLNRNKEQIAS